MDIFHFQNKRETPPNWQERKISVQTYWNVWNGINKLFFGSNKGLVFEDLVYKTEGIISCYIIFI